MSLALYLRADLVKASPQEKIPAEELGRAAARKKGEAFHEAASGKPVHKPALEGTKYEGFSGGAIHAPGHDVEHHGSIGKVPAGEAGGLKEQTMKVRPKGKRSTGYKRTGEEMEHQQSAWNKPMYKCKNCETRVIPPRHAVVKTEPELLSHLHTGGQWTGSNTKGEETEHHVEHPPKIISKVTGGKPASLPHGSVTAEHVTSGLCPSCHSKAGKKEVVASAKGRTPEEAKTKAEEAANKSVDMLSVMWHLSKAMEEGEDFGKPAATVSEEISHLIKEKDYPQKRAVAAALSMERRGDFEDGKKHKVSKSLGLFLAL